MLNNIKTIKHLINNYGFFNLFKKGFIFYKRKYIRSPQTLSSGYANSLGQVKKNGLSNLKWNNLDFFKIENIDKISKGLSALPKNEKMLIIELGEEILSNNYRFFSRIKLNVGSLNFNKDYLEGVIWDKGLDLSKYSQFDKKYGDIKRVFEINRFQYLDALIPYFHLSEDKKKKEIIDYIANFFDKWMIQNPYLKSVAWSCSQEISIRSIKLIFFFGFISHDLALKKNYVEYLFSSAKKVFEDIDYAVVQRNNHSITEACFLIIFGSLFDYTSFGLDCLSRGKDIIEKGIQEQFFEDGTYIQNSLTYQRFAIQSIMLTFQLIKNVIGENSFKKLCNSVEFFYYNIFDNDGRFPNYGPNDGAMLFNFGMTDYRDLRPITNLLSFNLQKEFYYDSHESLIDTFFLTNFSFNEINKKKDIEKINIKVFEKSSLFYINKNKLNIMACSTNFKNRYPSHCDGMHLDIWYKNKPVFTDSGSFEYYSKMGDKDFKSFLSTSYHNTIRLNKKDQLKKGPRFLWLTEMKSKNQIISGNTIYLQNYAYRNQLKGSPVLSRTVDINQNNLIVKDIIQLKTSHSTEIEQFWNYYKNAKLEISNNSIYFKEENLVLSFSASCPFEIYTEEGFQSFYYGRKEPRTRIVCLMKNNVSTEINTTFKFHD